MVHGNDYNGQVQSNNWILMEIIGWSMVGQWLIIVNNEWFIMVNNGKFNTRDELNIDGV